MKLTLEVTTLDEAKIGLNVLNAYIGNPVIGELKDPEDDGPHLNNEKPQTKKTAAKKSPTKKETEEKKPTAKKEKTEAKDDAIDLKSLTNTAKEAVARTDRDTVKEAISKYGNKLSAVDPDDYEKLAEELKAL